LKYLDLFSGYGGFSLGIQKAYEEMGQPDNSGNIKKQWSRPECIGFSEIDKYAIQVYQKHFKHKNYGNITTINPAELPDFDLLCGGFPCQAFSIAGKRMGFEDTRGTLIYDVFRIIKEKHPKLVLLENVKGLLSHDNGRTFKTIITSLNELGYAVEWQVLNAKNFGVPQNRERVFIIGHFGGFGGRKVFPITGEVQKDFRIVGQEVSRTVEANYWKGVSPNGHQGSKRQLVRIDEPNPQERGNQPDNSNSIRRTPYTDGMRIRRLTPTECERLMGLPDGWLRVGIDENGSEVKMSDTQSYKMAGNGVCIPVVEAIVSRLIKNYE